MFNKIKADLITAMKEQDKFKLDVIRMLKSAVQLEEINKKDTLTDDEVLAVIKREVKKRNSSIEEYSKFNKTDVVDSLKKEIEILSTYLPPELSEEEIITIVDNTIKELNAESIKDMGRVIKEISSKYAASVDMGKVSKIVKEKLN